MFMKYEYGNQTRRSSPARFEWRPLPEKPSFIFVDGCVHLKMTYWNKGYATMFLSFVGLVVCMEQYRYWTLMNHTKIDSSRWTIPFMFGFVSLVASMSSGILTCVYPAHNTLAFSVTLSSIVHVSRLMLADVTHIHFDSFSLVNLCQFMTISMALPAFHGIWTTWIPSNRRSVRHIPIVLYYALYQNNVSRVFDTNTVQDLRHLSYALGAAGLAWSVILWAYVVFGLKNELKTLRNVHSSTAQKLSDIPWKSMCSSKPILAIVVANVSEAMSYSFDYIFSISTVTLHKARKINVLTGVLIVFVVVLVEFFPKINFLSTTCVRKFWSCAFFGSRAVFYFWYLLPFNLHRFVGQFVLDLYSAIGVLYCFGFVVNHLDISPRHASVLVGIMETVKHLCYLFSSEVFHLIIYNEILQPHEVGILVAVLHVVAAMIYVTYASGELQPWAAAGRRSSSIRDLNNRFLL